MTDVALDPILDWLDELEAKDKLEPELMVVEATNPDHPAHGHFEWDDAVAAHSHRIEQARTLVRRYRIVREDNDGGEISYRRYTHLPSQGRYVSTERAAGIDAWREEILAHAKRDAATLAAKYRMLGRAVILDTVSEALDET